MKKYKYPYSFLWIIFIYLKIVTSNKIKWYSYCHFDSTNNDSILENLSCGKCSKYLESNSLYSTTQIPSKTTSFEQSAKIIFKYQTNRFPNEYYCSYYEKNSVFKNENQAESSEEIISVLPVLNSNWFHDDLSYLFEKHEIATNLKNSTIFNDLTESLKTIELIDLGIESIGQNSFSRFRNLKILRLSKNELNSFDLASFNSEQSNEGEFKSNLIELDLSYNKLSVIKLENYMYLNSLRVLNLSYNRIKIFDLNLISIVTPHLQVLDLSKNLLRKFKLLDNHLYFSSKNKTITNLSLVSNLILNELIYLDLSDNLLSDLTYLFSINSAALNETKYCNLTVRSKFKLKSFPIKKQQRPLIYVNLNHNKWKCDCFSQELIKGLKNLSSTPYGSSCYLNYLIKENLNLFKNLNLVNLNCTKDCKEIFNLSNSSRTSQLLLKSTTSVSTTLTTNNITQITTTVKSKSTKIPFKYDISATFYWICSICIAIVTISCLVVAWFFCWKKFKLSRANRDRNSVNPRSHPDQYTHRRNLYFLTNRLNSQFPVYRNTNNWRNRPVNDPGLFFISLNQNNGISDAVFNNIAYINDEPPNYYEAIMFKNRNNNGLDPNELQSVSPVEIINNVDESDVNVNDFLPLDTLNTSIEFIGEALTDIAEENEDPNESYRQSTEV
ncbi:unnamed protein product [Brachionus calyciflorus]|uniref:Uncharacterized protein n=1 Tax=Brachionus calyciflorus TaxID=104777 RepID=A0A813M4H3_9BILA|nr:unnamed protein product [Brachionus calyciflorus]